MSSHPLLARAAASMIRYGGSFADFVPVRGEGAFLYDAEGRRLLDFTSGQMSAILGHCHPEITATVTHWAGRLAHLHSSMLSQPVVELAEALAQLAPRGSTASCFSPPARSPTKRR